MSKSISKRKKRLIRWRNLRSKNSKTLLGNLKKSSLRLKKLPRKNALRVLNVSKVLCNKFKMNRLPLRKCEVN